MRISAELLLLGVAGLALFGWLVLMFPELVRWASAGDERLAAFVIWVVGVGGAATVALDSDFFHSSNPDVSMAIAALRLSQASTLLVLVAAMATIWSHVQRPSPLRGWLTALLLYMIVLAASSLLADSFGRANLIPIGAVIAVAACRRARVDQVARHARMVSRIIVGASLLLYVFERESAVRSGAPDGRFFELPQLAGLTAHPNGMGLIAALALILELHRPRSRLSAVWPALAFIALVLSQSRSGWFAALVGGLIWSHGHFGKIKSAALFTAAGIAGWLALGESVTETGLTGRERVWSIAWQLFLDQPLVGGGGAALRDAVEGTGLEWGGQAHNQILQSLATAGAIGTVLLVVFGVLAWRRAVVHWRAGQTMAMTLFGMIVARSVVESPVGSNLAFLTLVAVLAACPLALNDRADQRAIRQSREVSTERTGHPA
jgi:O-antigen ligase